MKPLSTFASALLLMASGAAFAATQPAAPQTGAPATASAQPDHKAQERHMKASEKTALAACKHMQGAGKAHCRKDAIAKANTARNHPKASRHA